MLVSSRLRQRLRLAEAGVAQTRWAILRGDAEPGFAAVVGPLDRKGRRLAEEATGGAEVTVTAWSSDGAFTALLGSGRAAGLAARAAAALGIEHGLTSTRLRLGLDGPRVVELRTDVSDREAELCRLAARDRRARARARRGSRAVRRSRVRTLRHGRCPSRLTSNVRNRYLRLAGTLAVTGLCTAYLIWKIDLSRTLHLLAHAHFGYFLGAVAIMIGTVWPMAWRWQQLLDVRGIHERLSWLTRAYFVAYTAGQLLPTAVGGDAVRIYETARRHPGEGGPVAGSVLLERALGGAATLALAAVGFALALGHYDVGAYLWIEGSFVLATIVLAVALFSRRARPLLAKTVPLLRLIRVERPIRAAYEGIHAYRDHPQLLVGVFTLTLAVQTIRVLAIWLAGRAVGVDLSPRPYYVMGPLLFLVLLLPISVNGIAVRESFFVSFLGNLGVDADKAFATGFLFFVVTLCLSAPGAVHPRLAEPARLHARDRARWLTSPSSSSRSTRCRGSSRRSRACAGTRRSSSTTARPTARSSSCASAFPRRA